MTERTERSEGHEGTAKKGTAMADRAREVLGVAVRDPSWFRPLDPRVYLAAGARTPQPLRVPTGDAQLILHQTIREVAGLPRDASPEVVLTAGRSELLVHTRGVGLACAPGLVTMGLPVGCDQLPNGGSVQVPFAVGTEDAPTGLVMAAYSRPSGPGVVVDAWAEALTAFAWSALVHLAQSLCAAAGTDATRRPLVPGYLSAGHDVLIVQPMAGHRPPGR
ncbi:MAG TPA: hypothetical protein VFB84_08360 [Micromonosporaceae bacterium]|nr:hypothetical protein [Micromonosporaceae bacterium]